MNRSPGSSVVTVETVTVVLLLVDPGIAYADSEDGRRFLINSESKIDFEPEVGQRLIVRATGRGHIISAQLTPTV